MITYYVSRDSVIQAKLQKELDEALGPYDDATNPVVSFEQAKRLPYLEAVINETLRLHSTSGLGLPRVVPQGGMSILGKYFPEGTVLSVPTYSIHRNEHIWGDDVDRFRPERWFEKDDTVLQKAFNPFSYGPR